MLNSYSSLNVLQPAWRPKITPDSLPLDSSWRWCLSLLKQKQVSTTAPQTCLLSYFFQLFPKIVNFKTLLLCVKYILELIYLTVWNQFFTNSNTIFLFKVDEEGAEAAAATVAQFRMKRGIIGPPPPPPIPFVVDHAFFFCILSPQPKSTLSLPVFTGHCILPVPKNR